jgi:hypothetical protein
MSALHGPPRIPPSEKSPALFEETVGEPSTDNIAAAEYSVEAPTRNTSVTWRPEEHSSSVNALHLPQDAVPRGRGTGSQDRQWPTIQTTHVPERPIHWNLPAQGTESKREPRNIIATTAPETHGRPERPQGFPLATSTRGLSSSAVIRSAEPSAEAHFEKTYPEYERTEPGRPTAHARHIYSEPGERIGDGMGGNFPLLMPDHSHPRNQNVRYESSPQTRSQSVQWPDLAYTSSPAAGWSGDAPQALVPPVHYGDPEPDLWPELPSQPPFSAQQDQKLQEWERRSRIDREQRGF